MFVNKILLFCSVLFMLIGAEKVFGYYEAMTICSGMLFLAYCVERIFPAWAFADFCRGLVEDKDSDKDKEG